ncbi:MAG: hypothetical protein H0T92_17535 [Pyrinomonadaceae bacterium]|nr:hypothetical protein [Pyrinomonadaceae bacterium]
MKHVSALAVLCLLLVPSIAAAQRRGAPAQRRTPAASSTQRRSASAVADGRGRVADQIKTLTRFLYLFGRVSSSVEMIDEQARRGRITPQETSLINKNKAALQTNLANVRDGLDQLELRFRTTPGLDRFYPRLVGVAAGAARAEEQAAANQLEQAGRSLLDTIARLTDVLLEMN